MLRLATREDAAELLRWRNDPATRFYRDDDRVIEMTEHLAWLDRRQDGPNKVYIFEHEGVPVGNVCLDVIGNRYELGWIVAPEYRRTGIGKRMVLAALDLVPAGAHVWAKLRYDNMASALLAQSCGFRLSGDDGDMVIFDGPARREMAA